MTTQEDVGDFVELDDAFVDRLVHSVVRSVKVFDYVLGMSASSRGSDVGRGTTRTNLSTLALSFNEYLQPFASSLFLKMLSSGQRNLKTVLSASLCFLLDFQCLLSVVFFHFYISYSYITGLITSKQEQHLKVRDDLSFVICVLDELKYLGYALSCFLVRFCVSNRY